MNAAASEHTVANFSVRFHIDFINSGLGNVKGCPAYAGLEYREAFPPAAGMRVTEVRKAARRILCRPEKFYTRICVHRYTYPLQFC